MAPVGISDMLGWASSTEVGLISLVVFLVLSVTLLALCVRCHRKSGNAYDVNGATTDGSSGMKSGGSAVAEPDYSNWRDHSNMPASTLERKERPKALTN